MLIVPTSVYADLMEPRISIITLGVEDLERSVRFYRDGLGLPRRDGPPEIAFFTMAGTWLALFARESLAKDAEVTPNGSGFRGFTLGVVTPALPSWRPNPRGRRHG